MRLLATAGHRRTQRKHYLLCALCALRWLFLHAKSEQRRLGRNLAIDVDPQSRPQLIEFFDPANQPPQSDLLRQRRQTVHRIDINNGIGASPGGEHEQVAQQRRDQGKLLLEVLTLFFAEVFSRFEQTIAIVSRRQQFEQFDQRPPLLAVDREVKGGGLADAPFGDAGQERGVRRRARIILNQILFHFGDGERCEIEPLRARADGRQQRVGARGQQNDCRGRGRLLKSLEQRIGGLFAQPVRLVNDEKALAAFARAKVDLFGHLARLGDLNELAVRTDDRHVSVAAGVYTTAHGAFIATIRRISAGGSLLTIRGLGEGQRELAFAHAVRPREDQSRIDAAILQQALKNFLVALIADEFCK